VLPSVVEIVFPVGWHVDAAQRAYLPWHVVTSARATELKTNVANNMVNNLTAISPVKGGTECQMKLYMKKIVAHIVLKQRWGVMEKGGRTRVQ
jgi:hypothetical protein